MFLRRALAAQGDDLPEHFEGIWLKPLVRLSGWILGLGLAFAGITLMVKASGSVFEAIGAVFAASGGVLLAAVVRCRRYEILVGRTWVNIGAGPLTHRIKRDLIAGFLKRPATGWRRLYADEEFELTLTVVDHQHVVPTLDPIELEAALGGCSALMAD